MAFMLNSGFINGGSWNKGALAILVKVSWDITPRDNAEIYPDIIAIRIGITPKNPLKYIVPSIPIPKVIIETVIHAHLGTFCIESTVKLELRPAQFIATPANPKPITITTEPTTIGGNTLFNQSVPVKLIIAATNI